MTTKLILLYFIQIFDCMLRPTSPLPSTMSMKTENMMNPTIGQAPSSYRYLKSYNGKSKLNALQNVT